MTMQHCYGFNHNSLFLDFVNSTRLRLGPFRVNEGLARTNIEKPLSHFWLTITLLRRTLMAHLKYGKPIPCSRSHLGATWFTKPFDTFLRSAEILVRHFLTSFNTLIADTASLV
jgi:hypothetical protein